MPPVPPPFEARLSSARALTPSVRELVFERVDGQPMAFQAGQWFNAILPVGGDEALSRSYSIASAPDGSPRFEIAVTRVRGGAGSAFLHEMAPGATLQFIGPHGFFTRPPSSGQPSLFVATGTGVTPIRAMLRAALASGDRAPLWVLLGVRKQEDLLYRDELEALAKAHASFRFEPTLSQPEEPWEGRRGYVQTHVPTLWKELVALGKGEPHAYICGLERMVSSVRDRLKVDLSVPRQQVHSERYD